MPRHLVWSIKAIRDFETQIDYIQARSPLGADLVADRIENCVSNLRDKPIGRPGRVIGAYERIVPKTSLVVAFELPDDRTVLILRVVHMSRYWPDGEWPE
jgi:toxin ParE1/3/4